MQREMRRRVGVRLRRGPGSSLRRGGRLRAATASTRRPGRRVLAVGVVAVNEEVVSARDIATGVADDAREPSPARHVTWWPDRGRGVVSRRRPCGGSHARGPFPRVAGSAAVNRGPLGGDPWVRAAYAEGQPWTRDPRGSRVRSCSPRIPHGKVTKWQSIRISPCQGAIIG